MTIDEILSEVSYRTETGIIDFSDPAHLVLLKVVLREGAYSENVVSECLLALPAITERLLHEKSNAAKDAHTKKLHSVGGGRWADESEKVVAKSDETGSRLIMLTKSRQSTEKPSTEAPPTEPPLPTTRQDTTKSTEGAKDKTLRPIDSLKQPAFTEPAISSAEFDEKNAAMYVEEPPPHLTGLRGMVSDAVFPLKYLDTIERLINTKPTGDATKITHFLPSAGAGTIDSQAGEIMTMVLTSLSDEDATKMFKVLYDQAKVYSDAGKNSIVKPEWVAAAWNNRNAVLQYMQKEYSGGKVQASAWDVPNEVEALGLTNYKKNKGKSTDVYFKVLLPDGSSKLVEMSLKKDSNVNLLNAGSGDFAVWDSKLPPELNHKHYSAEQAKRLVNASKKFGTLLAKLAKTKPSAKDTKQVQEFRKTIESKGFESYSAAADQLVEKGDKNSKKVVAFGMRALVSLGSKSAEVFVKSHEAFEKQFRSDAIKALNTNPNMKSGLLKRIVEDLPIRDILAGEEAMVIGNVSFDKHTARKIFGTDNFNAIKDKLMVVDVAGKDPRIVYSAGTIPPGEIPIASLRIREPGVGYTGSFKLAFQLLSDFAKTIHAAHKEVYGQVVDSPLKKGK